MKLRKYLPKLGKEQPDGSVDLFDHEFSRTVSARPDYNSFKSKKYNDHLTCVAVLIGLWNPEKIYTRFDEKMSLLMNELEHTIFDERGDQRWSDCKEMTSLLDEIKVVINIGLEKGKFETAGPNKLYYESLPFLNWMAENSFPIPPELRFHKNGNGDLEYIDPILYGGIEKTFPGHPKGNKSLNEDPLYAAFKIRQRLMDAIAIRRKDPDYFYKEINPNHYGARALIGDWLEKDYPKIPERMYEKIISIANDGFGVGINNF